MEEVISSIPIRFYQQPIKMNRLHTLTLFFLEERRC
jgi:hypothetical protein